MDDSCKASEDIIQLEYKAALIESVSGLPEGEGLLPAIEFLSKSQQECLKSNISLVELKSAIEALRVREIKLLALIDEDDKKYGSVSIPLTKKFGKTLQGTPLKEHIISLIRFRYFHIPNNENGLDYLENSEWDGSKFLSIRIGKHPEIQKSIKKNTQGLYFLRSMRIGDFNKMGNDPEVPEEEVDQKKLKGKQNTGQEIGLA